MSGVVASDTKPIISTEAAAAIDPSTTAALKIDPITALQDGIDGLSLAMFEALRGLRDAVAPESGNLAAVAGASGGGAAAGSSGGNSNEPDLEDLWHAYRKGDPNVVAMFQKVGGTTTTTTTVAGGLRRDDFVRLHAKMEMEKDTGLVLRLAKTVIDKSEEIDEQVDVLPGMNRTRTEQMQIIEQLISENAKAAADLQHAYDMAKEKRDASRKFIREETCKALGIDEEVRPP